MTTEIERIIDLLRRTFNDSPWHGPSLMEVLQDVAAAKAASRPIAHAHCIWELVLHITAWRNFTWQKLRGNADVDIATNSPEDWPTVSQVNEPDWQQAIQKLSESQQQLLEVLQQTNEAKLDETVPGKSYSFYTLLHGMIGHDIYHSGQIALLKKMEAGL